VIAIVDFDDIENDFVRRMARRIRVIPFWPVNSPYLAELRLVGPGAHAAAGHPFLLWASASTPREAIDQVIAMIRIWLRDPKSKLLVQAHDGSDRGVGVEPGPARLGMKAVDGHA